ncbi:MAG: apolipoprotein N-acyltransferase [Simkaniaceae bacterium]|nr:MAG: apolipoprotein N-acyltransferase [Simkaniaceae bacterium]
MITAILFIISFAIVAWGQPHISPLLSVLASCLGFALFWISLFRIQGKKNRFIYAALWFFAVQLVQLSWLASPTYQGTYIYFVYLALSLWLGVQFGVLPLFLPKKAPVRFRRILGIASLWTLMEWGRLFILCGFAWNPVGLSMTGFSIGGQFASIVGVFGLSFLVMVVNFLAVNLVTTRTKKALSAFGGFLIFPYLFGAAHIEYHDSQQKQKEPYHVALIQTALLPDQKQPYSGKEEKYVHPFLQWHHIISYIKEHHTKDLDLIVLPEYALPFSSHATVYPLTQIKQILGNELGDLDQLLEDPLAEIRGGEWFVSNALLIQALANHYGAEVVIGLDAEDGDKNYNAAFHFIPEGNEIFRYEKRVLLPLAEYLPFSFLKPLVARYGILNFFSHGKEAKITNGKHPISLSVCYEECFPHIMRNGRQKGAELFVNVTNDGWYPFSRLPEQHFIHGRVRAIENGVPLLRACNTGITAGVDSLGRTVARFENNEGKFELERGALYVPLDLYAFSTLYTFWGDALILILSLGCLVFLRDWKENPLAEKRSLT